MRIKKTTTDRVNDRDEQLPAEMARRNWWILAGLVLLSLLWGSAAVSLGVLAGGLISIAGFYWLHYSLKQALSEPSPGSAKRFQFSFLFRLATLAAAIAVLIAAVRVEPAALAAGLSVVIINLLLTILIRVTARGDNNQ